MARTETIEGVGRLLTYSEAAGALGTSASTVSRLVRSGVLGSIRSGPRSVKVPARAVEEFISTGGISSTEGKARRDP